MQELLREALCTQETTDQDLGGLRRFRKKTEQKVEIIVQLKPILRTSSKKIW
jgi:hypothetical protein